LTLNFDTEFVCLQDFTNILFIIWQRMQLNSPPLTVFVIDNW